MPIDYKNYHPMWKRISRFVRLIRAQNCCESCGIENYTVLEYVDECLETLYKFEVYKEARAFARKQNKHYVCVNGLGVRFAVVILTVAHLDHDVDNNELDNLKALCQRCHLGHDRRDNAQKRTYGQHGRHHNQTRLFT